MSKKIIVIGMGLFEEQAGGANKYMTDFANKLYEVYRNMEVFVPKIDDNKFNDKKYDYKINRFDDLKGIKNFIKRNKYIENQFRDKVFKNENDIIINSHFALCVYPLLKLSKKNNINIITHFHGPWALETKAQYNNLYSRVKYIIAKHIEKKVYKQSTKIITLSDAFKEILITEYGIDHNKINVISGATIINQSVLNISKEEAKEKLGWEKNKKYILTIRRLVKRMGIDLYLDAINEIDTKGCNFIIGGKGELKEKLEIKAKNMEANIVFKGYIPDEEIELYYRAADLYFLPTIALEGFGLVTIEAMGHGTPVIATNIGGSKEIIFEDSRGILVEPNKDSFKMILEKYINDELDLPKENKLIEIVKNEYSWDLVVSKFLSLID